MSILNKKLYNAAYKLTIIKKKKLKAWLKAWTIVGLLK